MNKTWKSLVPMVIAWLVTGCTSTPTVETTVVPKKESLTVLFQSHRASTLEHCGCHYFPFGGIDREANAVKAIRAEGRPVLYVDAGDLFGPEKEIGKNETHFKSKAEAIADMLNLMGLEVFAPGPLDFKLGLDNLKALRARSKFPFVSTNIVGENLKPVFDPYVILQKGSLRVAVLSYMPENTMLGTVGVTIVDPMTALTTQLEAVKGKSDLVVLLAQQDLKSNEKLAETLAGKVQIIIGTDATLSTDKAYWIANGKTLLMDPMQYGYTLGRLDVNFNLPLRGFESASSIAENVKNLTYWKNELANNPEDTYAQRQVRSIEANYQVTPIPDGSTYNLDLMKLDEQRFGTKNEITKMVSEQKKSVRRKAISE